MTDATSAKPLSEVLAQDSKPGVEIYKPAAKPEAKADNAEDKPVELGGPKGPEPTRYGDWEKKGRCIDF